MPFLLLLQGFLLWPHMAIDPLNHAFRIYTKKAFKCSKILEFLARVFSWSCKNKRHILDLKRKKEKKITTSKRNNDVFVLKQYEELISKIPQSHHVGYSPYTVIV